MKGSLSALAAVGALLAAGGPGVAQGEPAPVKGWTPVRPAEHPRLLFRKADLPALRKRAETPEGKAILARLEELLAKPFTLWHAAGWGFLHQLTGDKAHADQARQYVEKAFAGAPDRELGYDWLGTGGQVRHGPAVAAVALAYDFCYDAWDDAFRLKVAQGIQEKVGPIAANPRFDPRSFHFGAAQGGAGFAVLAVLGDPGVDSSRLGAIAETLEKNARRVLSEGFGPRGWSGEGHHASRFVTNTALLPYLQALRVAAGKDYVASTNVPWLTLRWAMEIVPRNGWPYFPFRGEHGGELLDRDGVWNGGEWCLGFGAVLEEHKPALLWIHQNFVEPGGQTYDVHTYPHRAAYAFVNWPFGVAPKNPADVLPRAAEDRRKGYFVLRNGWKDGDDVVVTAHLGTEAEGGAAPIGGGPVKVWGLGLRLDFPGGFGRATTVHFQSKPDGSAVLSAAPAPGAKDVTSLAVDYGGASGAPALVAMVGPTAGKLVYRDGVPGREVRPQDRTGPGGASAKFSVIAAGERTFYVLTLQKGKAPEARAEGDRVVVGGQTLSFDGEKIVLGK